MSKHHFYIPFTQSSTWAALNEYCNAKSPITINLSDCSCLFGLDHNTRSLVSYGGPIFTGRNENVAVVDFFSQLFSLIKEKKITSIEFRSLPPLRNWSLELENNFNKFGFKRIDWKTLIVDLRTSEEMLMKQFEHAARKGIKKAVRLGINIELCTNFDDYYNNFLLPYLSLTQKENKGIQYYQYAWELGTAEIYRYWVAKDEAGEPIGFLGTYSYQKVATEIMSATAPKAIEEKLPVQDLLHFEIMKFHKQLGDHYFDLAGIHPNPSSPKEQGIRRFKEKWGGQIYDTSSFVWSRTSFLKKFFRRARSIIYG